LANRHKISREKVSGRTEGRFANRPYPGLAVAEQFLSCPDPRLAAIVASIGYSYRLTVVKITKVPVPAKA
jgi:hypothetical protein